MRTLFLLGPGQDPCVKMSERRKVLLVDRPEWNHFWGQMDRTDKEFDAAMEDKAKREAVKKGSKDMQASWTNTVLKNRQRRLDANKQRKEDERAAKEAMSREMQELRAAERKTYILQCKRELFYEQDGPKGLNSALRFSEVLREREAQIELQKKIRKIEEAKQERYAASVKRDAELLEKENEEASKQEWERKTQLRKAQLEDLRNTEKEKKRQDEEQKEWEREVLRRMANEIRMIEEGIQREKESKQQFVRQNTLDNLKDVDEARKLRKREEDMEDQILAIYAATKQKIAKKRKQKEKELQQMMVLKTQKLADQVAAIVSTQEEEEEASCRKAIAEREKQQEEIRLKEVAHRKMLKEERIEQHRLYLEEQAREEERMKHVLKWEVMQKIKREEENEEWERQQRLQKEENMRVVRQYLLESVEEKQKRARKELEEELRLFGAKAETYVVQDKKFFEYADELVEECKVKGRRIDPILRVVHDYKVKHELIKTKKYPEMLESKITIGRKSRPKKESTTNCKER